MQQLLTDDEIVALANASRVPWPFPLTTVRPDMAPAVLAATQRGIRSLLVRGMASVGESGVGLDSDIVGQYSAAASAPKTIIAHATTADRLTLSGSAVIAFVNGESIVLDTVTAMGIHALREASESEAHEALVAFAASAFRGHTPAPESTAAVVAASDSDTVQRVCVGRVEEGLVRESDGKYELAISATQDSMTAVEDYIRRGL